MLFVLMVVGVLMVAGVVVVAAAAAFFFSPLISDGIADLLSGTHEAAHAFSPFCLAAHVKTKL